MRARKAEGSITSAIDGSYLDASRRSFDEYRFQLSVRNVGELTIRDFVLSIRNRNCDGLFYSMNPDSKMDIGAERRNRFQRKQYVAENIEKPEEKLFSQDRISFPDNTWYLRVPDGTTLAADAFVLEWTIFLEDAPPREGVIDLGIALQRIDSGEGMRRNR